MNSIVAAFGFALSTLNSCLFWAVISSTAFLLQSEHLSNPVFYRATSGLSLTMNSASPAVVAFVESHRLLNVAENKVDDLSEDLTTEAEVVLLESSERPVEQRLPQIAQLRDYQPLGGLVVQARLEEQPENLIAKKSIEPPSLYNDTGDLLPLKVRKQRLLEYYADQGLLTPSLESRAKQVMARHGVSENQTPTVYLSDSQGQPGTLATPYLSAPTEPTEPLAVAQGSTAPDRILIAAHRVRKAEPAGDELIDLLKGDPAQAGLYIVNGGIRFAGGLAYLMNEMSLHLYREQDGHQKDMGYVKADEAHYEIVVPKLSGDLVLELRHYTGQLLGLSRISLSDVASQLPGQSVISDLELVIQPSYDEISGQVVPEQVTAASRELQQSLVVEQFYSGAKALLESDGIFRVPGFEPGSTIYLKAQAKGYAPSIWQAQVGRHHRVQLTDERDLKVIAKELGLRHPWTEYSYITGRISGYGEKLDGYKVDVVDSQARVVYLNDLGIPDVSLDRTGRSGQFIALSPNQNETYLRAYKGGRIYPAQLAVRAAGQVFRMRFDHPTDQNLELQQDSVLAEGEPLRARLMGQEIFVQGDEQSVPFTVDGGQSYLEVEVAETIQHMAAKVYVSESAERIEVLRPTNAQLLRLIERSGQALRAEMVHLVGFYQSQRRVLLNGQPAGSLVYFDKNGEFVSLEDADRKAYGFLIANQQPGLTRVEFQHRDQATQKVMDIRLEPATVQLLPSF